MLGMLTPKITSSDLHLHRHPTKLPLTSRTQVAQKCKYSLILLLPSSKLIPTAKVFRLSFISNSQRPIIHHLWILSICREARYLADWWHTPNQTEDLQIIWQTLVTWIVIVKYFGTPDTAQKYKRLNRQNELNNFVQCPLSGTVLRNNPT